MMIGAPRFCTALYPFIALFDVSTVLMLFVFTTIKSSSYIWARGSFRSAVIMNDMLERIDFKYVTFSNRL